MPTPRDVAHAIDEDLHSRLRRVESVDWGEDYLSLHVVTSLRNTMRSIPNSVSRNFPQGAEESALGQCYFQVEAYKVTGGLEERHGDIAIVVRDMDLRRTGVGFYEAKAEGPYGGYPAFKMRQLRRLSASTPNLALLLYEWTAKAVFDDEYSLENMIDSSGRSTSRVRAFGANVAKKYPRPDYIPDLPQSFGPHFVSRYLTGRDLDYTRDPLLAVRRWLKVTRRASPLVVDVRISRNPFAWKEPEPLTLTGANSVTVLHPLSSSARIAPELICDQGVKSPADLL
jgi:hypothetical protein